MTFYDIFNGDADGICALHQLRLDEPRDSVLITGVKRDIALLEQVTAGAGDQLTVLDISLKTNSAALSRLLQAGAECTYFDHHFPGEIPQHPRLKAYIDTAPDICTSLLVDHYLQGRQRAWAVVAAFGDNLFDAARRAAAPLDLNESYLDMLQKLGEAINYNAYGDSIDDLHYPPAALYESMRRYASPFYFIESEPVFEVLRAGFADDMELAEVMNPQFSDERHALFIFPDAAWARRANGVFGNRLAREAPARAHAVLVQKAGGGYVVSVRAPLSRPSGADDLCRQFDSGGGRKGAAGINYLPPEHLDQFLEKFKAAF